MFSSFCTTERIFSPNGITVGDSALLGHFLEICSLAPGGQLLLTAPYYDKGFFDMFSKYFDVRKLSINVIAKNATGATELADSLCQYGWQNFSVSVSEHLHAKVFIFAALNGNYHAVIGSCNPTFAGIKKNLEVGVYIGAKPSTPEWQAIFDLKEFIKRQCHPLVKN